MSEPSSGERANRVEEIRAVHAGKRADTLEEAMLMADVAYLLDEHAGLIAIIKALIAAGDAVVASYESLAASSPTGDGQ